jgi:hypothetical protein
VLRRLSRPDRSAHARDCMRPLRKLEVPGFRLSEAVSDAAHVVAAQPLAAATICLTIEGDDELDGAALSDRREASRFLENDEYPN